MVELSIDQEKLSLIEASSNMGISGNIFGDVHSQMVLVKRR